jgi:hypothetical protein
MVHRYTLFVKGKIGGNGKGNVFERWRFVPGRRAKNASQEIGVPGPGGLRPYLGDREGDGDEREVTYDG